MCDWEHPSHSPRCEGNAGSLTEEESDSGEAEDQEMFLAGLEGDPVRMSSTPAPCLEAPPVLPASPDGTMSAGLKRKDPEHPVLRLLKKPRGEALHAGMQPLAPPQGSDGPGGYLDPCPLASIPPTPPSHRQPAPPLLPLSQPAGPQQVLSLHCPQAPPPWCPTEPVSHPQAPPLQLPSLPLQPWHTPPLQPPSLQLPSSPTHWPQAPLLHHQSTPLVLLPAWPRRCSGWGCNCGDGACQCCQQALPVHPECTWLLPVLSQPPPPLQQPLASPLQYPSPPRPCQLARSPPLPQPRPASPPALLDSRPLLQALCWSLTTTALA
nr:uncharacterized protein LOC125636702 [Caretta caretta]